MFAINRLLGFEKDLSQKRRCNWWFVDRIISTLGHGCYYRQHKITDEIWLRWWWHCCHTNTGDSPWCFLLASSGQKRITGQWNVVVPWNNLALMPQRVIVMQQLWPTIVQLGTLVLPPYKLPGRLYSVTWAVKVYKDMIWTILLAYSL